MSSSSQPAMALSRALLKFLLVVNLVTGVIVVTAFLASFAFSDVFTRYFEQRHFETWILLPTLRMWLLLALPYAGAIHIILSRLLQIVGSVASGNPFIPDNAARLRTIAWSLLVMQLLHLLFGVMVKIAASANAHMVWSFSLKGWLAVLLLFVLARVFEEGTRIRDDLEKMI